ncbi:hypothetical protein BU23DRAFT_568385 [Bimuria novae-zelandiae CBS 107.79]|uniref:Mid2 domain-containing protein n=1 Tax=Bimuria novae-zelandiae CBS 107.79 TaxID=1447943 RepID=A0A6A5VJ31_9PLEO|nr:hypothetical protein BU23DRAFT_568385 [Bimuria novae-zelandiae CBS 107.79]
MTTTTPRSLQIPWSTPWATPPPSSCSTLVVASSTAAYGATCNFAEEEKGSVTNSPLNTACLPWLAQTATPASNAFYSPATACPPSWSAVATATSGRDQWIDGETALSCCPNGFEDGSGGTCRPASTGTFPVIECGEADAEENEFSTYTGASWPTSAPVNVPALQLRFQASDIGSASATVSSSTVGSSTASSSISTLTGSTSPSSDSTNRGESRGGLSTGAKAAIGTVVPLAVIIIALAAFFLLRRRKNKKTTGMHDSAFVEIKDYPEPKTNIVQPNVGSTRGTATHETPEWNAELEATEAERRGEPVPAFDAAQSPVSELGGVARKPRKLVPAVELDGTPVASEMDVSPYMAYKPPLGRDA